MADCIVIDLKSRRREQPSQVDPMTDYAAVNRIMHKLAEILEQDLPTVSAASPDLPHLQQMLVAARRRAPADGS